MISTSTRYIIVQEELIPKVKNISLAVDTQQGCSNVVMKFSSSNNLDLEPRSQNHPHKNISRRINRLNCPSTGKFIDIFPYHGEDLMMILGKRDEINQSTDQKRVMFVPFQLKRPCYNVFRNPNSEVVGCFRQLADAVFHMHSQGLAHNDLSLENICVDEKGLLTVIDLDLSTVQCSDHHGFMGKDSYCSPEMAKFSRLIWGGIDAGVGGVDLMANDIWSLGVILFSMKFNIIPYVHIGDSSSTILCKSPSEFFKCLTEGMRGDDESSFVDLLALIFVPQSQRIDIKGIINHPYYLSL